MAVVGRVERNDGRGFGKTISLADGDANVIHKVDDLLRTGGAGHESMSHIATEAIADLVEDDGIQHTGLKVLQKSQFGTAALPSLRLLVTKVQCLLDELLPSWAGAFHHVVHAIVDALVQRRDSEQGRGLDHGQILQDERDASSDAHTGTVGDGTPKLTGLAVGMGPWQKGQGSVGLTDKVVRVIHHVTDAQYIAGRVRVEQFDALGLAGGARGVDQVGQIVRGGRQDGGLCTSLLLGSGHGGGEGMGLTLGGIEAEHGLDAGSAGQDLLLGAVVNVLRRTEHGAALRVVENVGPILGQLGLVHGDEGGIERVRGRGDGGPLPSVVGNDADLGEFLNACIMKLREVNEGGAM